MWVPPRVRVLCTYLHCKPKFKDRTNLRDGILQQGFEQPHAEATPSPTTRYRKTRLAVPRASWRGSGPRRASPATRVPAAAAAGRPAASC